MGVHFVNVANLDTRRDRLPFQQLSTEISTTAGHTSEVREVETLPDAALAAAGFALSSCES